MVEEQETNESLKERLSYLKNIVNDIEMQMNWQFCSDMLNKEIFEITMRKMDKVNTILDVAVNASAEIKAEKTANYFSGDECD